MQLIEIECCSYKGRFICPLPSWHTSKSSWIFNRLGLESCELIRRVCGHIYIYICAYVHMYDFWTFVYIYKYMYVFVPVCINTASPCISEGKDFCNILVKPRPSCLRWSESLFDGLEALDWPIAGRTIYIYIYIYILCPDNCMQSLCRKKRPNCASTIYFKSNILFVPAPLLVHVVPMAAFIRPPSISAC